ncbi:MAG: hypothetical protein ACUVRZ_05050 [Desulfobacca sp.]|uniref:hypothetical protein n=1 Tax=Desulfobacca sp. TaxID=2067990 RepID=UPI00404A49BE
MRRPGMVRLVDLQRAAAPACVEKFVPSVSRVISCPSADWAAAALVLASNPNWPPPSVRPCSGAHSGRKTFLDAALAIAHLKVMLFEQTVLTDCCNRSRAVQGREAENLLVFWNASASGLLGGR